MHDPNEESIDTTADTVEAIANGEAEDNNINTHDKSQVEDDEDDDDASLPSFVIGDLDDDDDNILDGDTWIEELECALLADCDPATLKKISEGRRIPASLRPDYWRALLALNDAVPVKLTGEYDLENQLDIRNDCEKLVESIEREIQPAKSLTDAEKLRLISDFESTLTTYVKARPELSYVSGNGWTDIIKVLYHLDLNDVHLYQMFLRIVDRYVPKDLSPKPLINTLSENSSSQSQQKVEENDQTKPIDSKKSERVNQPPQTSKFDEASYKKSIQAYHLLRLLIQYHDPELCSILDSRKVTPDLYVKDWFCSLFARSCPPNLALLIWDAHFKMADPFLVFFAAIVMVVNASDELKKNHMNQQEMLSVLETMPSKLQEDDIEDLYYLVSNHYTHSTPRSIRCYSHLFFMDTFGKTYLGNESPEDGQPLLDLKTTQLTSSLDLSLYLCLPIVPAEIFALETAQLRSSPTNNPSILKYFLVDCRPAEQYNAGHINRAFHLDCSLMLSEPSSFATAVSVLLDIQRQVVASKSNTGGQHLCFIGSGHEEEDQYVNMVVASFLQKHQKYVSIVVGGFEAIHNYVSNKRELRESFSKYIVDHNPEMCKTCYSKSPEGIANFEARKANIVKKSPSASSALGGGGFSSAQSLFATTTNFLRGEKASAVASLNKLASNPQATATANMLVQSGTSIFDKFTTAFVSKSNIIKDRLVETLNTTSLPTGGSSSGRDHVSSDDRLGKRYTGSSFRYAIDDSDDINYRTSIKETASEPVQEIQIDLWQKQTNIIAFHRCSQIKGNSRYPGYIALSKTHLWILREIPHNKGFASIAAKRPLDMIVQITSKRRQPDLIIFRYGYANQSGQSSNGDKSQASKSEMSLDIREGQDKKPPSIIASDHLHIPQAFEVIRLIKHEIVRIMDETSRSETEAYLGGEHN